MSYFCSKSFLSIFCTWIYIWCSLLTVTERSTPVFTFMLNFELTDIKTNAFTKLSICASAYLDCAQRHRVFSLIFWFGLVMWVKLSKGQLVWCQFGEPLLVLFIHTRPDVLLLVMPVFGFQLAVLLSVRKNLPEIPGLQELFHFVKITLFLNVNRRTSLFIIF